MDLQKVYWKEYYIYLHRNPGQPRPHSKSLSPKEKRTNSKIPNRDLAGLPVSKINWNINDNLWIYYF